MLNFLRINDAADPLFSKLYDLYVISFPPNERRSRAGLEHEMLNEERFNPHALLQNDQFVGFFNYWIFERFCYLEHFAVNPHMRNRNIGREAMGIFMSQVKLPIVFEVEMPGDILASRRIHFYERLGFSVVAQNYAQPPYDKGGFLMPVLIMSNDVHFANTHFTMIKEILYNHVYHYKSSSDRNDLTED